MLLLPEMADFCRENPEKVAEMLVEASYWFEEEVTNGKDDGYRKLAI